MTTCGMHHGNSRKFGRMSNGAFDPHGKLGGIPMRARNNGTIEYPMKAPWDSTRTFRSKEYTSWDDP